MVAALKDLRSSILDEKDKVANTGVIGDSAPSSSSLQSSITSDSEDSRSSTKQSIRVRPNSQTANVEAAHNNNNKEKGQVTT